MSRLLELASSLYSSIVALIATSPRQSDTAEIHPLTLHNTLTDSVERFVPSVNKTVKMYNCGPTVYGPQHIGNLSMFVFVDILRRVLEWDGYSVKQVINFTDVGHLVSDGDEGEDKMTKGLKREKLALTLQNMKKLGKKYADAFLSDIENLHIETTGTTFPYASEYIPAQIAMVQTLEEKGYAYAGKHGVYFDTSRFSEYGKLGNIDLSGLREGARVEKSDEKRNPIDFLLWKFDGKLGWDSPWGKGFPGWHIECSAMSHSLLGDQLDIHTGGIEHIPVHHNNEIAQSEAASGKKPFSRFWLHRAHLQIDGAKIAKSSGKTVYLKDILKKKFHPMAFRYLLLGSHYRSSASFTWEALKASQQAFLRIRMAVDTAPDGGVSSPTHIARFHERINDDLDTPGALAVVWDLMKDKSVSQADLRATLLRMDRVLGLGLSLKDDMAQALYGKERGTLVTEVSDEIAQLLEERQKARDEKRWSDSDRIRDELSKKGFILTDTAGGQELKKK